MEKKTMVKKLGFLGGSSYKSSLNHVILFVHIPLQVPKIPKIVVFICDMYILSCHPKPLHTCVVVVPAKSWDVCCEFQETLLQESTAQ